MVISVKDKNKARRRVHGVWGMAILYKVAREELIEKMTPCRDLKGVMEQAMDTPGRWQYQAAGTASAKALR